MDSRDLNVEQAEKLREIVSRQLRFLTRLCRRMERLGFPQDDRLYRAAMQAENAVHGLNVEAHYASCKSGVGR